MMRVLFGRAALRFITYVLFLTPFTQAIQMAYYILILHLSDGQLLLALEAAVPLSFIISLVALPLVTLIVRWQDRRLPLTAPSEEHPIYTVRSRRLVDEPQNVEPMTGPSPFVVPSVRGDGGVVSEVHPLNDPPSPL